MDQTLKVINYAITSRPLMVKVINELDLLTKKNSDAELEGLLNGIQRNVKVNVRENNLFSISYVDRNPRVARDFVNTLVRLYVEENVSSKREESYGATKFLSEQIGDFKDKLEKADAELARFKAAKGGVITIDEARLFGEINLSQQKLYDIQLRRKHLEGLKPVTRRTSDPLQGNLLALQKRLEELRSQFTDSYPEIVRIKGEIETVKEQLRARKDEGATVSDPQELDRIEAELGALRTSEESLKRYIATNQSLLKSIPTAKASLEQLEMEKRKQKELYDQLMTRHGQSEMSKQMEVQDKTTTFRIVDPAVMPINPVSPNRLKIMLMGLVGGIACGAGLIILRDSLSNTVKSVDAAKAFGYPVLAVIPRMQDIAVTEQMRRKDIRLYAAATTYFCLLLVFVAIEALHLGYVDRVLERAGVVERLR
jgi:polysaccharide chain length determinant protein (PEP-CTERM system associated)